MNNKVLFFALTMLLTPASCIMYGAQKEMLNRQEEAQQENISEQQIAVEFFMLSINEEEQKLIESASCDTPSIKNVLDALVPIDIAEPISLGIKFDLPALVKELDKLNMVQVVANPYLMCSNHKKTIVTITTEPTFVDKSANSSIELTPTINNDGTITLDLDITIEKLINSSDITQCKVTKTITTIDKEVLLLEVPLEDENTGYKENLLIFVSSNLIDSKNQ